MEGEGGLQGERLALEQLRGGKGSLGRAACSRGLGFLRRDKSSA